jgi:hypothetical protein
MLAGMNTAGLVAALVLTGCAYGVGGQSQPARILARDWGCEPVRVDSIRNAHRKDKATPTPHVGERACDFFARLNWWYDYTWVGNDRMVTIPAYRKTRWLRLTRVTEGDGSFWIIADRVW